MRKHSKAQKYLNQAAFNLYQTSEASYKTILLVFTNYNPNEHLLGLLVSMAEKDNRALRNIFPKKTKREEKLFELLDYAYIGARYDPKYRIAKDDLEYLSGCVRMLLELTEKICLKKIESF